MNPCPMHLLTCLYRSRKSFAFSTHTCPNCNLSTRVLLICRPRLLRLKRPVNRSLLVSGTVITTLAWEMTIPLMISTAPSCKGGKWWIMVALNDLNLELSAIWHLDGLWGMYFCSQEMLIVGHNKLFACASLMISGPRGHSCQYLCIFWLKPVACSGGASTISTSN